ncbi:uncharacterized protein LOC115622970 isoform X2 [Scaptodrosophila lebanonensis]|uniref:Uncharacterized protein LOC115622970 isoform X2 n=1 Tax=Drosophila lebanonensis TaxID=7225 RepID=A0A6J2T7R0_DROLE|nr:uncharacterized protein LOC115622970 isoform X2 [Scaptodrosophila lebanonensis]
MSSYGTMMKHPSVAPRQRQTRANRLTRHSCFTLKREKGFTVRKSLVDYVDEELQDMETSVFYQRIYVLAKNAPLGETRFSLISGGTVATTATVGTVGTGDTAGTAGTAGTGSTIDDNGEEVVGADTEKPETEEHEAEVEEAAEANQNVEGEGETRLSSPDTADGGETEQQNAEVEVQRPNKDDEEVLTQTFRFDVGDSDEPEAPSEEPPQQPSEHLEALHDNCLRKMFTPDPMCGLFLYMGEYSMLMLEGSEDMMGLFCRDLLLTIDEFWRDNRVFLVEDYIKELYTKEIIARRIPGAYINEKFPTSTPNDEYLMGKQHKIIKDKLFTICRMVAESMEPAPVESSESDKTESTTESTDDSQLSDSSTPKAVDSGIMDNLPVEIYRKLLPEIQRIELVLASTRFYNTLRQFSDLYGQVPFTTDDDGNYWPIQNNYTPPYIFRRTPFDINLTFNEYAAFMKRARESQQESQRSSFLLEEEGEGEEVPPNKPKEEGE